MAKLILFCLGIPFKILVLGTVLSLVAISLFDHLALRANPEYNGLDAWFMYWTVGGLSLLFSVLLSFSVFLNLNKTIAENEEVSICTFMVPTLPLFIPAFLIFYNTMYLIFLLLVSIPIIVLQYYNYTRFRRNMKEGKYFINK